MFDEGATNPSHQKVREARIEKTISMGLKKS